LYYIYHDSKAIVYKILFNSRYFTNREVFVGGELTISKFRRKGLKTYGVHIRDLFLKEMGVTKKNSAISVRNAGNLKATIGRKNTIYAKAIYIKLLWWKFYKEILFSPPLSVEQIVLGQASKT